MSKIVFKIGSSRLSLLLKKGVGYRTFRKGSEKEFVIRHKSDIVRKLGALNSIFSRLPRPSSVVDSMAGLGFTACVLLNHWKGVRLFLNDKNEDCVKELRSNFGSSAELSCKDLFDWDPPACDLALLDFNRFTVKSIPYWRPVLKKFASASSRIVLSDSALYGVKFGNLSRYGVEDKTGYFELLRQKLSFTGKQSMTVCEFGNAAEVLLEEGEGSLRFVKSVKLTVCIVDGGGKIRSMRI